MTAFNRSFFMKKYVFLLLLLVSVNSASPASKPHNKFLEVLGHVKMLTGFAFIPAGLLAAGYSSAERWDYLHKSDPSQRKDLSIFAPIDPLYLSLGSIWLGVTLICWGAQDVRDSKETSSENFE